MKLRTFKELQDGQYHDVCLDDTITGKTFKATTFIVAVLMGLFILTHKMTIQIGIALIGGIGLYLWLSFYVVWYFILCETYWED